MKSLVLRRRNLEPLFALVDDDLYNQLNTVNWHSISTRNLQYASTHLGGNRQKLLHRYIMELVLGRPLLDSEEIDHIDKNGLNNQRSNLRLCTRSQNMHNTGHHRDAKSPYKGIHKDGGKKTSYWVASICVNYQRRSSYKKFDSPEEAAVEYDLLAIKYAGRYARLNFDENRQKYIEEVENGWQETLARKTASSHSGVSYNKDPKHRKNPWAVDIWKHGKKIAHVGHFATEQIAIEALSEWHNLPFADTG